MRFPTGGDSPQALSERTIRWNSGTDGRSQSNKLLISSMHLLLTVVGLSGFTAAECICGTACFIIVRMEEDSLLRPWILFVSRAFLTIPEREAYGKECWQ